MEKNFDPFSFLLIYSHKNKRMNLLYLKYSGIDYDSNDVAELAVKLKCSRKNLKDMELLCPKTSVLLKKNLALYFNIKDDGFVGYTPAKHNEKKIQSRQIPMGRT